MIKPPNPPVSPLLTHHALIRTKFLSGDYPAKIAKDLNISRWGVTLILRAIAIHDPLVASALATYKSSKSLSIQPMHWVRNFVACLRKSLWESGLCQCNTCHLVLPATTDNYSPGCMSVKMQSRCKSCNREYTKSWIKSNPYKYKQIRDRAIVRPEYIASQKLWRTRKRSELTCDVCTQPFSATYHQTKNKLKGHRVTCSPDCKSKLARMDMLSNSNARIVAGAARLTNEINDHFNKKYHNNTAIIVSTPTNN